MSDERLGVGLSPSGGLSAPLRNTDAAGEPYYDTVLATAGLALYWPLIADGNEIVHGVQNLALNGAVAFSGASLTPDAGEASAQLAGDGYLQGSSFDAGGSFFGLLDTKPAISIEVICRDGEGMSSSRPIFENVGRTNISRRWGIGIDTTIHTDALKPTVVWDNPNLGTPGHWHLVSVLRDGEAELWVNGQKVTTTGGGGTTFRSESAVALFGTNNTGTGWFYQGEIGHLAAYSVALSEATILEHARAAGLA